MELKGQVILDEDTMDNLKKQIRREVIDEIKENGNYSFEIEKYMKNCDFESYIRMIENTIQQVIENSYKNDIYVEHDQSDRKGWNRIIAIKKLLDI